VRSVTAGRVLRVLMNAEENQALAYLVDAATPTDFLTAAQDAVAKQTEDQWRWRYSMAEQIAADLDPERFGVKAVYLIGSTKNATAGLQSDIDLLIHVDGTPEQRHALDLWLLGWSQCLAKLNYLKTGYLAKELLDVHYVTDEDLLKKTSFAVKIGAVTDPARPLRIIRS
jgi:pyruvate, water dikinase